MATNLSIFPGTGVFSYDCGTYQKEAMRSIARRTAVGAALLLVMPVAVWISGWRWQPGEQSWLLKRLWVTETVTSPGASLHI